LREAGWQLAADRDASKEGPVFIKGVEVGDVVAIHVEDIVTSGTFGVDPDYGIIPEILELQCIRDVKFEVPMENGESILPGNIRVPYRRMIGSISLAAREQCPNPWDQGDGEISGTGMEANGEVTLTVNVSDKFPAPRPVIQMDNKVMTVGLGLTYWAAVRSAVRDMTYLLMSVRGISLAEAYSTAVKGGSLRNGAIWMMSDHHLIAMAGEEGRWPRTVFLELPLE